MLGKAIMGQGGAPQYNGNMNAPANYWQGNQMMVPGADGMGGLAQALGQRGLEMAQAQQQQGEEQKPPFDPMVAALGGLLPALLMGSLKGDTKKGTMGGAFGGLGALFG
jgi:hypothetical protein